MASDNTQEPRKGLSRRTVVKGAAWATPAVVMASAAPSMAASVIPCVPQVTDHSSDWVVDNAQYGTCNCRSHRDIVLRFDIASCPGASVTIEVQPVSGKAVWCAWTGNQVASKTVAANTNGSLLFPAVGDNYGSCAHTAYVSVNDGIHTNPCATGQIQWRYTIQGQPTSAWHLFTAPSIPGC